MVERERERERERGGAINFGSSHTRTYGTFLTHLLVYRWWFYRSFTTENKTLLSTVVSVFFFPFFVFFYCTLRRCDGEYLLQRVCDSIFRVWSDCIISFLSSLRIIIIGKWLEPLEQLFRNSQRPDPYTWERRFIRWEHESAHFHNAAFPSTARVSIILSRIIIAVARSNYSLGPLSGIRNSLHIPSVEE